MKVNLVEDWRKGWKWFSVNVPAVNTAFLATWALLPAKFQDVLPIPWVLGIAMTLIVLGIAGRLVNQSKAPP